jgi:hypothetical protein
VRLRSVTALIVLGVVAASCGGPGTERGVRVDEISTNIGLGVEPILNAAPPNIVVSQRPRREEFELPTLRTIPPFEVTTPQPVNCPRAGDFDFPAQEAGVDPDPRIRPSPGRYQYKLDGEIVTENGKFVVNEFETRTISDVEDDSAAPNAFRFIVKQSVLFDDRRGEGTLETTYRVVPTGNASSVPNPPAPAPAVSDAGRGVYLVSIIYRDKDGDRDIEQRFEPSNPLQLLAFPVEDGAMIDSSGTDPQTGAQVRIQGRVKGKKQVDACGDRVDSWFVDATQTLRYNDPETFQTQTIEADYNYGVAPQFGGMLVYERVKAPRDGPIVTIEARVGSVPKPTRSG